MKNAWTDGATSKFIQPPSLYPRYKPSFMQIYIFTYRLVSINFSKRDKVEGNLYRYQV